MKLKDRVAIITGGAKGMGRGMALKFTEEGCTVAIADIDLEGASETITEISKNGGKGLAIECDVTNINQVHSTVDKVVKDFGKIDILINNAGAILGKHESIEDMSEELWDKTQALNLKSNFLFCKFVVPHMKKAKYGKIVNLSSIGGIQPPGHVIAYNTAKGGVISFTYDLATTLAPLNINVNCLVPGPVRTHFYDAMLGSMPKDQQDKAFAMMGMGTPLQRYGTPEDIAEVALFLVSEASSFITGQLMYVSGGLPLAAPKPRTENK